MAYGLTFAWLLKAAVHEDLALSLLRVVGVISMAFAIYGLITFALGNTHVLWLEKTSYPNALTSTFISRNHAATFLGIGLLTCLALGMQRIGEISRQLAPLQRAKALWLLVLKPSWPWFLGAAVIWIALILTPPAALGWPLP